VVVLVLVLLLLVLLLVLLLLVANTINLGSDLGAMAAALNLPRKDVYRMALQLAERE
jgi:hypothetical protein